MRESIIDRNTGNDVYQEITIINQVDESFSLMDLYRLCLYTKTLVQGWNNSITVTTEIYSKDIMPIAC
jgi:hypothetical protein